MRTAHDIALSSLYNYCFFSLRVFFLHNTSPVQYGALTFSTEWNARQLSEEKNTFFFRRLWVYKKIISTDYLVSVQDIIRCHLFRIGK